MKARDFFKTSPMFDSVEIVREHKHNCHVCGQDFFCYRPNCAFEDRYAVCRSAACIAEFEKGAQGAMRSAAHSGKGILPQLEMNAGLWSLAASNPSTEHNARGACV